MIYDDLLPGRFTYDKGEEINSPSGNMMLRKIIYYLTHWETWNWLAKYIPILPAWFWYCLRSQSFWFFTASNPSIEFGGFLGEGKRQIYEQLPPGSYPKSIYISPAFSIDEVMALFEKHEFTYPAAVKPNAGMMGFMFRKINNLKELRRYHQAMPVDYIVQELVTFPIEVSVFYYRFPGAASGTITGFLKKEFLEVTGDGESTLLHLIENYQRVAFRQDEMKSKHAHRLGEIIPQGEKFCLSYALNLSRGGRLVSLEHEKDNRLLQVFDEISNYSKHFYFGRYDIKCASIEDLKSGKNFSILEYNGSGAEPHHIYGNGNTLMQAFSILLHHWNVLYKISRQNHRSGIPYYTHREGLRYFNAAQKHFKALRALDLKLEL